ncbi:hypothetical protein [Kribbella albertanoniae]|nr:hypothetical protein [Kribbella albertanoniae]
MLKVRWSGDLEHSSTVSAGITWLIGAQGGRAPAITSRRCDGGTVMPR